jgi:DNA primase/post-segregation antitoxin (ccd killing protein)/DNA-binding transcriptional ArsR family regulator
MARIPDQELERLKREVSLVRLIEGQGHRLISQGKDLACRCPWHEGDDTPSCIVSPKTNLWHCFGCNLGGSVIDWIMRSHKVSFRHACELLAKQHPGLSSAEADQGQARPKKLSQGKLRQAQSFSLEDGDQALLDQVIEFYHQTLQSSPEALKYLEGRGLGSLELIGRFKLGFANRTLAYRLAPSQYKAGVEHRAALQRVGILRESGHEHCNGSIVVPLFATGEDGRVRGPVVGAYARKIRDDLRPGTPKHLYLPGPHRGVFNREGLQGQQEVILCEALIDALTFWAAGYHNVTSCYGVNGMTDELLAALKACGAQRILIAFDRDEPGDRAADELAKKLMGEGLDCFRLLFPKGMDANEYARSVKPAEKSLGVVIRSAQWLGKGERPKLSTGDSAVSLSVADEVIRSPTSPDSEPLAYLAPLPDAIPLLAASAMCVLAEPEAAVMPASADPEPPATADEKQLVVSYGERRYRVRGWPKQLSEALKVNILVNLATDAGRDVEAGEAQLHIDTLDLYQAKQRQAFAKCAATELRLDESVIQRDLGRLLMKLETLIDERAREAEQPKVAPLPSMTREEMDAALAFLKDPALTDRIVADFERVGLVGEPSNALVAYLACISRKLASPLAVLIQSTSAAGKSTLMDSVLTLMPSEDRVHYSAMTGQSLFYLGEQEIKHRILAIAEEEGVRQAAYALKVLQSQGELTIASTGKDPATGMLVTQQYRVEGPVMLFLTTTAIDVDEELVNRCLVLTINESREQTRLIQQRQRARRTLAGLMAQSEAEAITQLHQHAQRLLRPLAVVNPYAEQLTFLDDRTRTRRDHAKYLTLIESIALLRQHQREVRAMQRGNRRIEYIEVTLDDIALANRLAHEVLGRSLDELPPQTRRVLGLAEALVLEHAKQVPRHKVRFTRRELRARGGMSDAAIRVHLERLVEMEYVRPAAGRRGLCFEYELLFDGNVEASAPQMIGLIDIDQLVTTMGTSQGAAPHLAPPTQAVRTPFVPTSQGAQNEEKPCSDSALSNTVPTTAKKARQGKPLARNRSRTRTASAAAASSESSSSLLAADCPGV